MNKPKRHQPKARAQQPKTKRRHFVAILVVLLALGAGYLILSNIETNDEADSTATEETETDTFDTDRHAVDEPDSLWVVVNKQRPLPNSYTPAELIVPDIPLYGSREEENMQVDARIEEDLIRLIEAATKEGVNLALGSGYRSASYQEGIYNAYVERDGQEEADTYSARPGHSEHQTGLAVDFVRPDGECSYQECFEDTPEGEWLRANAHQFGFILRYEQNNQEVVGYRYEPWHFRYVGHDLAEELHDRGNPTLEEFFDLPPAPTYPES